MVELTPDGSDAAMCKTCRNLVLINAINCRSPAASTAADRLGLFVGQFN